MKTHNCLPAPIQCLQSVIQGMSLATRIVSVRASTHFTAACVCLVCAVPLHTRCMRCIHCTCPCANISPSTVPPRHACDKPIQGFTQSNAVVQLALSTVGATSSGLSVISYLLKHCMLFRPSLKLGTQLVSRLRELRLSQSAEARCFEMVSARPGAHHVELDFRGRPPQGLRLLQD